MRNFPRFYRPLTHLFAAASLLAGGFFGHVAAADSLASNGGFEEDAQGWKVFVPEESKEKNCRFDVVSEKPHSGANCARFQSDDFARFSIGSGLIPVQAGERYRVTVWLRSDPSAEVRPKDPGFVVRLNLRQGSSDAEGGYLFIGPGNKVTRSTPPDPELPLPTTWTKIEAVVEIPAGVDAMGPGLFSWWAKGALYADDLSIEKVDSSTPATPLQ